jgi:hypothetical protein
VSPGPNQWTNIVDYFLRPVLTLYGKDSDQGGSAPQEWFHIVVDNFPESKVVTRTRVRGGFLGQEGGWSVADPNRVPDLQVFPNYIIGWNRDVLPAVAKLIRFGLSEAQALLNGPLSGAQLSAFTVNSKEQRIAVWVNCEPSPRLDVRNFKTPFPDAVLGLEVNVVLPCKLQRPQLDDERSAQNSFLRYYSACALDLMFNEAFKEHTKVFEALRNLSAWREIVQTILIQGYGQAVLNKPEILSLLTGGVETPDTTTILHLMSEAATSRATVVELLTQIENKDETYFASLENLVKKQSESQDETAMGMAELRELINRLEKK